MVDCIMVFNKNFNFFMTMLNVGFVAQYAVLSIFLVLRSPFRAWISLGTSLHYCEMHTFLEQALNETERPGL